MVNSSEPKGVVNISVDGANGGKEIVLTIPVTPIPIDVTTVAPKASILSSQNFRRMVTKGIIKLIKEEDALSALDNQEARAEERRIYNYQQNLDNVVDDLHRNHNGHPDVGEDLRTRKESLFVLNLVESDLDEGQASTMLAGNITNLTVDDLEYLVSNSKHAKVKTMAAEMLMSMK